MSLLFKNQSQLLVCHNNKMCKQAHDFAKSNASPKSRIKIVIREQHKYKLHVAAKSLCEAQSGYPVKDKSSCAQFCR